ncbi:MAG TPA: hypothetical protein VJB16_03295 [archaeon]|nr:hypothetical protein [archaeon]
MLDILVVDGWEAAREAAGRCYQGRNGDVRYAPDLRTFYRRLEEGPPDGILVDPFLLPGPSETYQPHAIVLSGPGQAMGMAAAHLARGRGFPVVVTSNVVPGEPGSWALDRAQRDGFKVTHCLVVPEEKLNGDPGNGNGFWMRAYRTLLEEMSRARGARPR